MPDHPSHVVTQLLTAVNQGEEGATEQLWQAVYDELHRIARWQMSKERAGHTLQATALINEAYCRLFPGEEVHWSAKAHFFSAAAEAMRRICIDSARKRKRLKRGGGAGVSSLEDEVPVLEHDPGEALEVHEALEMLEAEQPRKAQVVKLRYFGGLTVEETAAVLGVSPRTVDSDSRIARAWMYRYLSGDRSNQG